MAGALDLIPVDTVRVCQVIHAYNARRGHGVEDDPIRVIHQFFTLDGKKIVEIDAIADQQKQNALDIANTLKDDVPRLATFRLRRHSVPSPLIRYFLPPSSTYTSNAGRFVSASNMNLSPTNPFLGLT